MSNYEGTINLRRAFLIRDNFSCRICSSADQLELHHLFHENSFLEDIITLCRRCHNLLHVTERLLKDPQAIPTYDFCEPCERKGINEELFEKKINSSKSIRVCTRCGRIMVTNHDTGGLEVFENPFHDKILEYIGYGALFSYV